MKKSIQLTIIIIILFIKGTFGQKADESPYLPNIIPPSPNAASLGKYGDIPISAYTGIPSVNIPVYNAKNINVSLSYQSNGLKVEEVASNVGLGWSLNAGGVITRTVRGLPDDMATVGYFANNVSYGNLTDEVICDYYSKQGQNKIDLQPDSYFFNLGGISGKFIVKKENGALKAYTENVDGGLKIEWLLSESKWKIIDSNGNEYYFGTSLDGTAQAVDRVTSRSLTNRDLPSLSHISAWYLIDFVPHVGTAVKYKYQGYENTSCQRANETKFYPFNLASSCTAPPDKVEFTELLTQGSKIKEIQFDNGKIKFDYSTIEREDYKGDFPLKSISIYSNNKLDSALKVFELSYGYFNATSGNTFNSYTTPCQEGSDAAKRLKLESIVECDGKQNCLPSHQFEYFQNGSFPYRFSFAQDHWGYYNGKLENTSLIPKYRFYNYEDKNYVILDGANREPDINGTSQLLGTLKKIVFPTGGSTNFEYEPNTAFMKDNDWEVLEATTTLASVTGTQYVASGNKKVVSSFKLTRQSFVKIEINTAGYTCDNTVRGGDCDRITLTINGPKNVNLSGFNTYPSQKFSTNIDLPEGTYTLELDLEGTNTSVIQGFSSRVLGPKQNPKDYSKIVGGVRIKKTITQSCSTCGEEVVAYKYIDSQGNSSGVLTNMPIYEYVVKKPGDESNGGYSGCNLLVRTSFSQIPLGITQGAHLGYARVEKVNGDSEKNYGKNVTYYTTSNDYPDTGDKGYPFTPLLSNETKRGKIKGTEDYLYNGNLLQLISSVSNKYEFSAYSQILDGLLIGKTYIGPETYLNPKCSNLIAKGYSVKTGALLLSETISSSFDESGNEFKTKKNYIYNKTDIFLTKTPLIHPQQINETTSKGDIQITVYKYPYEYTDPISVGMTNKNIISVALETINKLQKGSSIINISSEKNVYDLVFSKYYLPKSIESKIANESSFTKITFDSYNSDGYLTKYTPKDGSSVSLGYYTSSDLGKAYQLSWKANKLGHKTEYDYEPLKGIKTVKDPNGKITTYKYDNFSRLISISDQNGMLKSYSYNYSEKQDGTLQLIGSPGSLIQEVQECKMCCTAEAVASTSTTVNNPLKNCTNGQISLFSTGSSTGEDITYKWNGPNGFYSQSKDPSITTNLANATGVYTLTVTKSNNTCIATSSSTTQVYVDCVCPFEINTNGTTVGPLTCQNTIALSGNCTGCSTGELITGMESYVSNGRFSNVDNPSSQFSSESNYMFTTNPNSINGSFTSFGEHSNVAGSSMLLIAHSENTLEKVWYQTITIKPNTRYIFSAWIAPAYPNNNTTVRWIIDGALQQEKISMGNKAGGEWQQLKTVWNSGDQTSIVVALSKENAFGHNWFVIDDVSLTEVPEGAKFEWTGPDNYSEVAKNAFVRNVGLKNTGVYNLKVTDKGCTKTVQTNINVNCQPCLETTPLMVFASSNSPVSCGNNINLFATSNKTGVNYTWYKLNSDGTDELLPQSERNKVNPTLLAPISTETKRFGYLVHAFKNGCTSSSTSSVEVKCDQSGEIDIALNLRIDGATNNVVAGQTYSICADMINQSPYQNAGSVRAKVLLPECLEFQGSVWGLPTGQHSVHSEGYFEDIWYNPQTREVSNISSQERRGYSDWMYWGAPIGIGQTLSMCFSVKATQNKTIVLKSEVTGIQDFNWRQMPDVDSQPNNGYDNGEDDRSVLILNPNSNSLEISTNQIRTNFEASSNDVILTSVNSNWAASSSSNWISLSNSTGGNGVSTLKVNLLANLSAQARFGTVTIDAGCGLTRVIKIKQSGKAECPTVQLSNNNPYCGDQLKLFANIIPSTNKDLVLNGDFERGNVDFNPEDFHDYSTAVGGPLGYLISATPKTDPSGMWFIDRECPGENSNPSCSIVNRVRILFRNDCCWDRLSGAKIQGSNNKSQWEDIYVFGNATGQWQDITFNNLKKYSFIRFLSSNNGYGELREIEFYNNSTKLSGQLFSSLNVSGSNYVLNATDGNQNTMWQSSNTGEDAFIGLELNGCSLTGNLPTSLSGTGKQMAVAASWTHDAVFWSQYILVDPNTNYNISVKAVQLGNYDTVPVELYFDVDGVYTNIMGVIPNQGCTWKKISGVWNSGDNFGPVKLSLRFINPNANGKLFSIDDISVKPNVQGAVSSNPVTYNWVAPNSTSQGILQGSTTSEAYLNNVKTLNTGIYQLTATQNGCSITEKIDVNISCSQQTCPVPAISSPYPIVCSNMSQTATLKAIGCLSGNTVKWSDGQTSATQPYVDPVTGRNTTISTIVTPALKQSVIYTAQCVSECGISNKSNEVQLYVYDVPSPPVIGPGSTIEKKPGEEGTILYASGCNNGIIQWSNGTTGTSTWIPSLGYQVGKFVEINAVCKTECAESNVSNKVKIIVICQVDMPSYMNIVELPQCSTNSGTATLEGACSQGVLRWYIGERFIGEGNRISYNVETNTEFKSRCELSQSCVSSFAKANVLFYGKPAKPIIKGSISNLENPNLVNLDLNTSITLSTIGCQTGGSVSWNITGYPGLTSSSSDILILTPTIVGQIVVNASCRLNGCESDKETLTINVNANGTCSATNPIVLSPNVSSLTINKGNTQTITASGCSGDSYRWFKDGIEVTSSTNKNIVNLATNTVGNFNYVVNCVSNSCPYSKGISVNITESGACIAVQLSQSNSKCGSKDITANVTKNGTQYTNVLYVWYQRNIGAIDNGNILPSSAQNITVYQNAEYKVVVTDMQNGNCIMSSEWSVIQLDRSAVQNFAISPVSNPVSLTVGQNQTLSTSGCTNGVVKWFVNNKETATSNSISINTTSEGNYEYVANCYAENCLNVQTRTVIVKPVSCSNLLVSISKSSEGCGFTNLTATNYQGLEYRWYYRPNDSGALVNLAGSNNNYTALQSGDYRVEVVNGACISTSTWFNVVILSSLTQKPSVSTSSITGNAGSSQTITATNCPVGSTYVWDNGNTGSTFTFTLTKDAIISVRCRTETSYSTCYSEATSINVKIQCAVSAPTMNYINPTSKVCSGASITLGASCVIGTPRWFNSETSPTVIATGASYTTNSLNRVYASCNNGSCDSPRSSIETQVNLGLIKIEPNCSYRQMDVISPISADNSYEYYWSGAGGVISGQSSIGINTSGTYVLKVKYKGTSCEASTAYTVSQFPLDATPVLNLSSDPFNCSTKITKINLSTGGAYNSLLNPYSIKWFKDGTELKSYADSYFINASETGTYTPKVTSALLSKCEASQSIAITIPLEPKAPEISVVNNCGNVLATAVCLNGTTPKWSNGSESPTITHTSSTSTLYTVQCKNLQGCLGPSKSISLQTSDLTAALCTFCNNLIEPIQGSSAPYNQSFTYPSGGGTRNINVKFEAFCVPDQLVISINGKVVVASGCMGSGAIISSGGNPNLSKSDTKNFSFEIKDGDILNVSVTPTCTSTSTYYCEYNPTTVWRLTFTCSLTK
jgi:YD repeat-containing protein